MVDGAALEVVDKFCYLGYMISTGGGAEKSVIARTRSAWKKFRVSYLSRLAGVSSFAQRVGCTRHVIERSCCMI
mgnify:CR=1 FL=1